MYKHGLHHGARYFNSKSGNDTKKDELFDAEKTETNEKTSDEIYESHEDLEEAKSTEQKLRYFECKKSCSSIQKIFSSEDAFQLHEDYFHSEDIRSPNQTQ